MASGAPTGKWETLPAQLERADATDLRRAEARLVVRRPGVPEVEIGLDKSEFVIGRLASEVDLVLDDDSVSRRHARLTMDARGYFRLEDVGSQNGIRFKGRLVRRLNLLDGDRFHIGRTEIEFHAKISRFEHTPPPAPAPRAASTFEPPLPGQPRPPGGGKAPQGGSG